MSIRTFIDEGLQYLTNRRTEEMATIKTKNVSRRRQTSPGEVVAVCGACGGDIIEVNSATHKRACFICGRVPHRNDEGYRSKRRQ